MKKIGYFFSGFLPILTTTAAQILASFFMFGIAALFLCPASQSTGFDADTIETLLTNTEFNACIMLIYTVTCIVFMGIWYYRSCGGNYLPKPSLTFHPLQFLSIILLGQTKFACVDGPDFDGDLVDFDEAMARGTMYRPFEAHAREAACNLFHQEVK